MPKTVEESFRMALLCSGTAEAIVYALWGIILEIRKLNNHNPHKYQEPTYGG